MHSWQIRDMILPDDPSLTFVLVGGAAAAVVKIAEHFWAVYMRGRGEKRADHAERVVEHGYAQLVADLQQDNKRLNALVEKLAAKVDEQTVLIEQQRQRIYDLGQLVERRKIS